MVNICSAFLFRGKVFLGFGKLPAFLSSVGAVGLSLSFEIRIGTKPLWVASGRVEDVFRQFGEFAVERNDSSLALALQNNRIAGLRGSFWGEDGLALGGVFSSGCCLFCATELFPAQWRGGRLAW